MNGIRTKGTNDHRFSHCDSTCWSKHDQTMRAYLKKEPPLVHGEPDTTVKECRQRWEYIDYQPRRQLCQRSRLLLSPWGSSWPQEKMNFADVHDFFRLLEDQLAERKNELCRRLRLLPSPWGSSWPNETWSCRRQPKNQNTASLVENSNKQGRLEDSPQTTMSETCKTQVLVSFPNTISPVAYTDKAHKSTQVNCPLVLQNIIPSEDTSVSTPFAEHFLFPFRKKSTGGVRGEGAELLADAKVPQLDGLVVGAGDHHKVVELDAGDAVVVLAERDQPPARIERPHLERLVVGRADYPPGVRLQAPYDTCIRLEIFKYVCCFESRRSWNNSRVWSRVLGQERHTFYKLLKWLSTTRTTNNRLL